MHRHLEDGLADGTLHDRIAVIAEEAAALIRPYWRAGVQTMTKADDSPVTIADQKAEALILERLASLYPGVQVVAEEASEAGGRPETAADWFWLIDPLDGTKGFIGGKESFTVNIALIHEGRPVAGVVNAPALTLTWATGGEGGGARRRPEGGAWETVRVRARPERGSALLSHSMRGEAAERLAKAHGCLEWAGEDSSLKFCRIAEGAADVYPRTGPTSEWDTAAGQAVLEAAGGRVLTLENGPVGDALAYGKPGFLNGGFVAMGAEAGRF